MSTSLSQITATLDAALSPDPQTRQASLSQLQQWATVPTFYSNLTTIFATRDLNLAQTTRLQALVQFKNGVDKYWRKGSINGIAQTERVSIRPQLLAMVDEPDRVLAKTVALCVGKIARIDYGTDWDELPGSLVASLQLGLTHTNPPYARIVLHRSLLFLHATIKSLSSNRIMKGRILMRDVGSKLFPTLRDLYTFVLGNAVGRLEREGLEGVEDIEDFELALLAFKSLSTLTVYGYGDASEDATARAFFVGTPSTLASLIALRLRVVAQTTPPPPATPRLVLLTKLVNSHVKLYRSLISHDPGVFIRMGAAPAIVETVWHAVQAAGVSPSTSISDDLASPYPERFVANSLLLLKSCMGDWAAKSPVDVSPEFVGTFVEVLVTKLLPLRAVDLDKWAEDPEEWMNEEEADRYEFELRPCAEYVLQSVLGHYKEMLGPSMAQLLRDTADPRSATDLLVKEGIYCAFGGSPSDLRSSIDFNAWLDQTLIPEALGSDSDYRIIRRRIAWLLGKWVDEDLEPATLSKIYTLLLHLLSQNASTDTAIRLTAARSLSKCGDTWDFDVKLFLPFLPGAVGEIVQLLGAVALPDSRMRLNQTLGVIIDRVQDEIAPYAGQLAAVLATLWSSTAENHFQTSVLVTITKLAEALGERSQGLHSQAGPIIQLSVDPTLPSHIYLQGDALELWQVLLRRSTVLSPEMLALLPLLVSLLTSGTDVLPHVLKIFESYLLLDAPQVLQLCSIEVCVAFENLLGDLNLEPLKTILRALETMFQTAPMEQWALALDGSLAMVKLVKYATGTESAQVVTKYLCTISRIVLAGPETFYQLIEATAGRLGCSPHALLDALLTQLIDRIDNMAQASQRKLTALALGSLLPLAQPTALARLGDLASLWSGVLAETEENESGDAELYRTPDEYLQEEYDYPDTLESGRRQALSARDPVHSTKMIPFLTAKLEEAQVMHGGPEALHARFLTTVDPIVLEELMKRLGQQLVG